MSKEFTQIEWSSESADVCRHLIRLAIREDLEQGYDWTTVALVPEASQGQAHLMARRAGVVAGLVTIPLITEVMDTPIEWHPHVQDGDRIDASACLGTLRGPGRDLLTSERLILNFVGRLSGIATMTSRYVAQVHGTAAGIYDTRKTCPGYRHLEKYAVRCGGGRNHRSGLYDAILIKDNHLAFARGQAAHTYSAAEAVEVARRFVQSTLPADLAATMIIEIEVDTLEQFKQVLAARPDIVLLDNMTLDELRAAVADRDRQQSPTQLEASGGVSLETVRAIAQTGVDRISVGALTHSAPNLDVGLDWVTD